MNQKTKRVVFVAVVFSLMSSPLVFAASPERGWGGKRDIMGKMGNRHEKLFEELNLSEEQKKKLDENKNKYRDQHKALMDQLKEKRALLQKELQNESLDKPKILQIQNDLKTLENQMSDQRLQGVLDVREILTADQYKKFQSRMEEKMGEMKDRWEKRRVGNRRGPEGGENPSSEPPASPKDAGEK